MIAALKVIHIAALCLWCAALLLLPLILQLHGQIIRRGDVAGNYARFRRLSHGCYTLIATPAAVIAIAAGTGLIFAADITAPWFLAKLAFVALMVLGHIWLGHLTLKAAENDLSWRMPPATLAFLWVLPAMAAVLWLVLAKPDVAGVRALMPDWALTPLHIDLPLALDSALSAVSGER